MSALELLKSLVAIPSVNPFQYFHRPNDSGVVGIGSEEKMNLFLEQYLRDAGFEVSRQEVNAKDQFEINGKRIEAPARWNVLGIRYPKEEWNGKSILFFGHTDTVDVKHGWESDPFSISVRHIDGCERWYGLGANDMKGGLAAALDAARSSQCRGYALKIALVVDEEYYSFGAEALCASNFLDDVVLAIAPEMGDTLGRAQSPIEQLIGIGRTGRVEFDVSITGQACHGSDAFLSPHMVNAVHESVKIQHALIEYFSSIRRSFSKSGAQSTNAAYLSFHHGGEPMLSVPDSAQFVIDRTFLPDESPEEELLRLREIVNTLQRDGRIDSRAKVSISPRPRPTPPCKPYIASLESGEVQALISAVKRCAPKHSYYIGRSVADENRVALRGMPTLSLGPSGAGSHTSHEWVDPASVTLTNQIFKTFLAEL